MVVHNWRSYKDAKKFIHSLNLKSKNEWAEYAKYNEKPKDIPTGVRQVYKKEWKGWGDWLGTGTIATYNMQYRSFSEARKFGHSIKARTSQEWKEQTKSGKKPDDIPSDIRNHYKNKGWKGWADFLNTKEKPKKERYRSFKEAREYAHSLKFESGKHWENYCKSGKRPYDIPRHPERHYKDWKGMGDWLGTGRIASINMQYRSFEDAREFVRKLKLKDIQEWKEYTRSGKKPDDIPANLYQTYKGKFKAGDWLGTGRIANQDRKYRSFSEARKFACSLNLKGESEWSKYSGSGKRPNYIPGHPQHVYEEWKDWGDFLGTGNVAPKNRKFLPWPEAKKEYQRLGKKYGLTNLEEFMNFFRKNSVKLPKNLPLAPWMYYTKAKVWKRMMK